jgi:hypothetical protein
VVKKRGWLFDYFVGSISLIGYIPSAGSSGTFANALLMASGFVASHLQYIFSGLASCARAKYIRF